MLPSVLTGKMGERAGSDGDAKGDWLWIGSEDASGAGACRAAGKDFWVIVAFLDNGGGWDLSRRSARQPCSGADPAVPP